MPNIYIRGQKIELSGEVAINIEGDTIKVYHEVDIVRDKLSNQEARDKAVKLLGPSANGSLIGSATNHIKYGRAVLAPSPARDLYAEGTLVAQGRGPATDAATLKHLERRCQLIGLVSFINVASGIMDYAKQQAGKQFGMRGIALHSVIGRMQRDDYRTGAALSSVASTLAHFGYLRMTRETNSKMFTITKKGKDFDPKRFRLVTSASD